MSFPTAYVRNGLAMAGLTSGDGEITEYCEVAAGRNRDVTFPGGGRVYVPAAQPNADAPALARCLATLPSWTLALCDDLDEARAKLAELAPTPRNLLGAGCVRKAMDGRLWLLGDPEKGWSAFGFCVDDWDELFRRFNVRIGVPVQDATGQYWPAEPYAPPVLP